jgi:putative aldouronate transport system permease protein
LRVDQNVQLEPANLEGKPERVKEVLNHIRKHRWLYFMMVPGILYFVIFRYIPMFGIVIAFQDYQPFLGISDSKWVGLKHFNRFFTEPTFFMLLRNTLMLFVYNIVFVFPVPIILALMLNELRRQAVKRIVQTVIYMPHFLSWVIVVSLTYIMLTTEGGIINDLLVLLGKEKINFMLSEGWFRPLYTIQSIWRDAGWGTIVYLAAIAGVDPNLYEAARMDGANRFRQIWHITLPGIRSVIVILLILKMGDIMDLSFDHVYLMLNAMNRSVAEVFDTYVYTTGILGGQFSYSATVGVFKSAAGLMMVLIANRLAKMFGEEGIW